MLTEISDAFRKERGGQNFPESPAAAPPPPSPPAPQRERPRCGGVEGHKLRHFLLFENFLLFAT